MLNRVDRSMWNRGNRSMWNRGDRRMWNRGDRSMWKIQKICKGGQGRMENCKGQETGKANGEVR